MSPVFSTLFTAAIYATLAFSAAVIALTITRTSISFAFNPYVARFGRYRNQFLIGRYRVIVTRA